MSNVDEIHRLYSETPIQQNSRSAGISSGESGILFAILVRIYAPPNPNLYRTKSHCVIFPCEWMLTCRVAYSAAAGEGKETAYSKKGKFVPYVKHDFLTKESRYNFNTIPVFYKIKLAIICKRTESKPQKWNFVVQCKK